MDRTLKTQEGHLGIGWQKRRITGTRLRAAVYVGYGNLVALFEDHTLQ